MTNNTNPTEFTFNFGDDELFAAAQYRLWADLPPNTKVVEVYEHAEANGWSVNVKSGGNFKEALDVGFGFALLVAITDESLVWLSRSGVET